jgi:aminodeoxychorismate lyase
MQVLFNGGFVPEEEAAVSIFDRGLCYGDGLFETLRVSHSRPFRWTEHLNRLAHGAKVLGIDLPYSAKELSAQAAEIIQRSALRQGLLRMMLSRGQGPRGYSPRGAKEPWLAMSVHPLPAATLRKPACWRLVLSSYRVQANDALACLKTCNKLHQVLARREAEDQGGDEALLLNTRGYVAEASSANLFWIEDGSVFTPPIGSGALEGITRGVVFEICSRLGIRCREHNCRVGHLKSAQGVFLTLSSLGIVEAGSLDGVALRRSAATQQIRVAYEQLLHL